jgi:tetratricopeptide (TPR) repeat protein
MNTTTITLNSLWTLVLDDPNDIQRLQKWITVNESLSGRSGARDALKRAACLDASWLAKIWFTRLLLLEDHRLEESLELYRKALRLAPRRSLAVQEIAGHLGEAGYFREAVDLLLPIYSPDDHGPWAGFNLFNACEDAGDLDAAQVVLDRMEKARWTDEPNAAQLKNIVRIRQEKLHLLRSADNSSRQN